MTVPDGGEVGDLLVERQELLDRREVIERRLEEIEARMLAIISDSSPKPEGDQP